MMIQNTTAADLRPEAVHTAGRSCRSISCCVPRRRRAWGPPVLPAGTPPKRRVDHLLPRSGWQAVAYFAAVIGLLGLARRLPAPAYLVVDAIAFLAGGSWCALNFWRCRQAHCLITGAGWLLLALFAGAEAGHGHSVIGGDEQLVFLGILAVGVIFEGSWYLVHRDNAVTPARTGPASTRRTPAGIGRPPKDPAGRAAATTTGVSRGAAQPAGTPERRPRRCADTSS